MKVTIPTYYNGAKISNFDRNKALTISKCSAGLIRLSWDRLNIEVNADQLRKSLAVLNDNTPYKQN